MADQGAQRMSSTTASHLPRPSDRVSKSSSSSEHKCSVCLELFTDPKVLPCCHTFCLECLKKTATREKTRGQITCPKCRESHVIPEGGLSEFLTDFITNYEIEVEGVSSKNAKDTVCGECEQSRPISHFCSDCQNYLCEECGLELHKRLKTFRGHKVIPISEISVTAFQSSKVYYCQVHKGEPLKLYCETCKKLVCRDCILVDHHQHSYKFVQDARKQVTAEMMDLKSKVEKKLPKLKHDLQVIRKVETVVNGHPHALKADINVFFDNLVKSIEKRRTALLQEADEACQKDLKQVWADRNFHETAISHISAVFGLTDKACRCASDSEMILTALQSMSQLRLIKEREWDRKAFVKMFLSAPCFKQEKVCFETKISVKLPSKELKVSNFSQRASLYSCFQAIITCSPTKPLIDHRSGETIDLMPTVLFPNLEVVVLYGKAKKVLDSRYVTVSNQLDFGTRHIRRSQQAFIVIPDTTQVDPTNTGSYTVTIQLLCGGVHHVIFRYGNSELTHTFNVDGYPQNNQQVRKGPDWRPELEQRVKNRRLTQQPYRRPNSWQLQPLYPLQGTTSLSNQLGHVCTRLADLGAGVGGGPFGDSSYAGQDAVKDTVAVSDNFGQLEYKWGQDGQYEVELCI